MHRHLGFKTWSHTPTERGFDSWFGYYGGSTDYYKIESLCWAGPFEDGCFQSTNDGEAVTGCDLHRHVAGGARSDVCNSTEYSTILFTQEAERVIDAHAAEVVTRDVERGEGGVCADERGDEDA